ncbi:MAG TPA: DUF742 domain-containing protein [Acidimicrobiales bacterium]|nr:DUF742 domain-containing protein [Acidimicrobiales bacterium]
MSPSNRLVRPYAITGGRTRSRTTHLPMEALVVCSAEGHSRTRLVLERRRIAELCETPVSVAEISAHLEVPLGVARVLVGDMADDGLVQVSQPRTGRPDIVLLERVLNGIRAL